MRKMILFMTLILGIGTWQTTKAQAIHINLNINLDRQPDWGPVGYEYAPYYYIPALDIYYEVNTARFYYRHGSVWVYASVLPAMYSQYNLYSLYKVVIRDRNPWAYNKLHRTAYRQYKKAPGQPSIRRADNYRYASRNMRGPSSPAPARVASSVREPDRNSNRGFAPSRPSRPASPDRVRENSAPAKTGKERPAQSVSNQRGEQNKAAAKDRSNARSSNSNRKTDSGSARSSNRGF